MTDSPMRVAFAGLAHSHPYTDAGNVAALGGEVVGVFDADAATAAEFSRRFGGTAVASLDDLRRLEPDMVIATPRPHDVVPYLRALGRADAPVFVNKVIAATIGRLDDVDRAIEASSVPVGTSSVLRFAPSLARLAAEVAGQEVLGVRVRAQHDNTAFQLPYRAWQDDPQLGGGTLVTVGVHAWEMIDVVLPGAVLAEETGWVRRRSGSTTRSEDAGGIEGMLRLDVSRSVPVQVLVTGVRGADGYAVDVVTAAGIRSVELAVEDANESLGFRGLIRSLLDETSEGRTVAPWTQARTVVANTIRAAEIARAAS